MASIANASLGAEGALALRDQWAGHKNKESQEDASNRTHKDAIGVWQAQHSEDAYHLPLRERQHKQILQTLTVAIANVSR